MLLSLLLQTTPAQNTPYAIYATLTVGVLSLIASGLNIYFSSKTAQKVVNLSTKTTREVAELSAQVSRESAALAAQTARDIKEKDYKNDFYKKIIERRLDAWEKSEKLVHSLSFAVVDRRNGLLLPKYCNDVDEFDKMLRDTRSQEFQSVWMGGDYTVCLMNIHNKLVFIRSRCEIGPLDVYGMSNLDLDLLREAGKENMEELSILYNKLASTLVLLIPSLHNVEAFFQNLAIVKSKVEKMS